MFSALSRGATNFNTFLAIQNTTKMFSIHGIHKSRKCIKNFSFSLFCTFPNPPLPFFLYGYLSNSKTRIHIFHSWLFLYRRKHTTKRRQTKFIFALLIIAAFHISFDVSTKYKYQNCESGRCLKHEYQKHTENSAWNVFPLMSFFSLI